MTSEPSERIPPLHGCAAPALSPALALAPALRSRSRPLSRLCQRIGRTARVLKSEG
jgi:hypothetical protein